MLRRATEQSSSGFHYEHRVRSPISFISAIVIDMISTQIDRTIPIEDTWKELKKLKKEGKGGNSGRDPQGACGNSC
jgi:hypothetical protein